MEGEILSVILKVSLLVFVVSSMLAMGLSLTVGQIVEPLRSVRLVLIALAANFVAVPIIGWGIGELLSLDEGLAIGLTIMATAAGAPFLPKLAEAAKGDLAFSVGLMVLLMVVTVAYMPLVLPLLISGVEVDPWAIASSLIFLMLLPLAIGLLVRGRYEDTAAGLQPLMTQTSTVAIAVLLVAGVIVNFDDIVDLIGTGGFAAIVLFLAAAAVGGYFGGGRDPAGHRRRNCRSVGPAVDLTRPSQTPGDAYLDRPRHDPSVPRNHWGISLPPSLVGLVSWEMTIADSVKEAGYRDAIYGRWDCGKQPGRLPTDHGFDEWQNMIEAM